MRWKLNHSNSAPRIVLSPAVLTTSRRIPLLQALPTYQSGFLSVKIEKKTGSKNNTPHTAW